MSQLIKERANFANRLRVYLSERFPLGPYVLLMLAFTLSAYALAPALSHTSSPLRLDWTALAGFITVLLIFFHLRIFDEFKDLETDLKFHPERPIPRGLVTLSEMRTLGLAVIAIEIALNLLLGGKIFLFYLAVLLYSLLMFKEFFIGRWLRRDLFIYALTHTPIMVLIGLYAHAVYTVQHQLAIARSIGFYLAICFLTGLLFEIARKVRAPEDEREGVETYSKYFGTTRVATVLILLLLWSTLGAWGIGWAGKFSVYYYALTMLVFVAVSVGVWNYRRTPSPTNAKRIGLYTSLYTLALYGFIILECVWSRGIVFGF